MILRIAALTLLLVCTTVCSRAPMVGPSDANSLEHTLPNAVNINTASAAELQLVPHVGESLAAKIIEHREVNGPFRRVEHLMLIPGISDKRFRKIRPLVRVE